MIARLPCLYRHLPTLLGLRQISSSIRRCALCIAAAKSSIPSAAFPNAKREALRWQTRNLWYSVAQPTLNNRVHTGSSVTAAGCRPLPLAPRCIGDEKQTDGGGGEIDWKWGLAVSCVCARSGGREGADQRRKNIKGKRGKSPNGSEQREERRGGREGRPGQFTSVIYFLPGNLQVRTNRSAVCPSDLPSHSLFHR